MRLPYILHDVVDEKLKSSYLLLNKSPAAVKQKHSSTLQHRSAVMNRGCLKDLQGVRVGGWLQPQGRHDSDKLVCGFSSGFHARGPRDHHFARREQKTRSLRFSYSHNLLVQCILRSRIEFGLTKGCCCCCNLSSHYLIARNVTCW